MVFREVTIQEYRRIIGFKQETLCEALGVTQAMYSKIETGKCKTTPQKYQILAETLGVDLEDVMANQIRIYVFVDTKNLKLTTLERDRDEIDRAMIEIIESVRRAYTLHEKLRG